ncbi:MAG: hypothetical protein V3T86_10310, partial [Planctomycetota bacterium]
MRVLTSFLLVIGSAAPIWAQASEDGTNEAKLEPDVYWARDWSVHLDNGDTVGARFQSLKNGALNVYLDVAPRRLVSIPAKRIVKAHTKRAVLRRRYSQDRSIEPEYNAMVRLTDGPRLWGRFSGIGDGAVSVASPKFGVVPVPLHRVRELQLGVTPRDKQGTSDLALDRNPLILVNPTHAELLASWHDLAGTDAFRLWEATQRFQRSGDLAMAFLEARLDVPPDSVACLQTYVALLGSPRAGVRNAAQQYLRDQLSTAPPQLMIALGQDQSAEVRRRIKLLLKSRADDEKEPRVHSRDVVRVERALRVLEDLGHDRARKLIQH